MSTFKENIIEIKKFFKKVILFLLPLLIIIIILEVTTRALPEELYKEERDYINAHKDSIELIILGTSANTCGLNPKYFSMPAVNLANGSQSFEYDYILLEKYIHELPNLKYAVIEFAYPSLYLDTYTNHTFRIYYYYRYFDCDKYINLLSLKKYSFFLINPMRNLIRIQLEFLTSNKNDNNVTFAGWELMNGNFDKMTKEEVVIDGDKKYKYHWNEFFSGELYTKNKEYVEKIINLCIEKDIELYILTPPAYKTYSSNILPDKLDLMYTVINSLLMDPKIHYLDLFTDERFEFSDFYNHNHLNGNGAIKYSSIVNDFIRSDNKN